MVERAMVCFLHGAFVAFAFKRLAEHRSFFLGGLIGVALHFMLNLPTFLAASDLFGLGRQTWSALAASWIAIFVICLAVAVMRLGRQRAA